MSDEMYAKIDALKRPRGKYPTGYLVRVSQETFSLLGRVKERTGLSYGKTVQLAVTELAEQLRPENES